MPVITQRSYDIICPSTMPICSLFLMLPHGYRSRTNAHMLVDEAHTEDLGVPLQPIEANHEDMLQGNLLQGNQLPNE
jgi:hypothetical protein